MRRQENAKKKKNTKNGKYLENPNEVKEEVVEEINKKTRAILSVEKKRKLIKLNKIPKKLNFTWPKSTGRRRHVDNSEKLTITLD